MLFISIYRALVDNDDENHENVPLIGTMALVPQIVDALKIEIKDRFTPVIAAGGIADGRGLVAALALGASGIAISVSPGGVSTKLASLCHHQPAIWIYYVMKPESSFDTSIILSVLSLITDRL